VPNATVNISNAANGSTSTAADGSFSFAGLASTGTSVTPAKTGDVNGAITAIDAVVVLKAVTGSLGLTADQFLSADTSGNGTLSAIDASLLLQYVVGAISSLPAATHCGSEWLFHPVPASAQNQQTILPVMASCQSGAITYSPLSGSAVSQDFNAILLGDVNASWTPEAAAPLSTKPAAHIELGTPVRGRRTRRVRLPLIVQEPRSFQSLEVLLTYDPTAIAAIRIRRVPSRTQGIVAANTQTPGKVRLALASPTSIEAGNILWIDVYPRSRRPSLQSLRLIEASADSLP